MTFTVYCPNGHRLRAQPQDVGKTAKCPKCRAAIVVPQPPAAEVSDSSVVRLLEECTSNQLRSAPAVQPSAASTQTCPRCGTNVSGLVRICPLCRVYLA